MKRKFLWFVPLAASLLLSSCNSGTGSVNTSKNTISVTPTVSVTDTVSQRDDSAIVSRLGVDYRENWKPYLITFDGLKTCDYWFIKSGDTYHAYFLVNNPDGADKGQHIAHATSTDFLNWSYQGIVLRGYDNKGWNDRNLATGSVAKYGDTYYMLYTGQSTKMGGIGVARSKDLNTWERIGDNQSPQISAGKTYTAEYNGVSHRCTILADPYIYPEAIDGYYYAYINSWASDQPKNSRGCQLMFRSKDMIQWEPYKIATLTDDLDRLETCQVWKHGDKWYMSFGGRRVDPNGGDFDDVESANYIYMADHFDGPYEKQEWSKLSYPSATGPYIQKALTDPFGDEVMLVMSPWKGVLWPYSITYGKEGKISFDVIFR